MAKSKKTKQLNIRVTPSTIETLDRIAVEEDRGRSELARFFVEWAVDRYAAFGSLKEMRINPIAPTPRSMLQPPHVTAVQPGAAEQMLKTRQEAKEHGETGGRNRKHKSAGDAGA